MSYTLSRMHQIAGYRLLIPLITSLGSLIIYLLTAAPDIGWGDSAEFALQAYQLGVTHPPGYPIHTFLGRFFMLMFPEPIIATNFLSVASTSLATGLLSLMILEMTDDLFASIVAPLIFAFSSVVWAMAVITEVYNVNIFIFGLSLFSFLLWYRTPTFKLLVCTAVLFGISLGSYLANLLLLPGFIFLIYQHQEKRKQNILTFMISSGLVGVTVLSWSVFRSQTFPPLGSMHVPYTPMGTIRYFVATQYGSVTILGVGFFLKRVLEHSYSFGVNLFGVGMVLGLVGFISQYRRQRPLALTFLVMVAINFGYFTNYANGDYFTMITPTYFIFTIWMGYGIALISTLESSRFNLALRTIIILIIAVFFIVRFQTKVVLASSSPNAEFCLTSLKEFPKNAVVISNYGYFPCLLYFQKVHKLRTDVTLIEHEGQRRYYENNIVIYGHLNYIASVIGIRPVIIDYVDRELKNQYEINPVNEHWFQLKTIGRRFGDLR